ncbi:hypothetical protein E0Z10_g10105 [Xylaria hypoxylon]|uniref:GH16 domain-containing protein n=1 Tax=Xylaria hypoxylon TaxID=37992 RepID=A0A4Z0YIZ5_9PEZI|nr:hypothetical protein E0Z10_g10105 [Xylaria hypoxylon]
MPKRKFISLLSTLGLAAQFVNGQLEPDCNPLHADCPAKKAWPEENYYIDFTKETGPPANWIIANYEVVKFTPQGAEFTYGKKGDAPNMWTDFYILGGRYDVELQIAPGQGVISSSVLWSDIQDEIDWEFSGNQHGEKPFPPPDGKWTVETNIFAQGKMWDGAATYQKDAYNPTTQFHTYSVEWDENHMNWYVDNQVVRSVQASNVPSGFTLPQSPMKLQLGVWGGGDPDNNYWTIEWAGGEIDMKGIPYTMYVRSVNITNKYPACQYKYKDRTGKITGIDKIHDGCSSSLATTSASTTQPKIIKNSPEAETPASISSMGIDSSSMISEPADTGSAASSSPSSSSPVSLMSDTMTGQPTSTSSAASSEFTPSTIAGGYPVASLSSTGGILSSLSSLFLGTSSGVSSASALPTPGSNGTYPATFITTSDSTLTSRPDSIPGTPGSSNIKLTTPTTSTIQSLTVGNSSSVGGITASTISTVYSTNIYTVTSCAPTVKNCPVGQVSTELISITTTLCPVTGVSGSGSVTTSNFDSGSPTPSGVSSTPSSSQETGSLSLSSFASSLSSTSAPFVFSNASSETMPTTYTFSSEITTSFMLTVYSTNIITITSCAPTVKNCPVGQVTTETVSLYTTICPVTNTIIDDKTFSGQPSQADSTTAAVSSSTLMSSLPAPISSQLSASIVSSDSPATSLVPSLGTSSSVYMSSAIYQNTTVPGSLPAATQLSSTPVQLTTSTVYSTNIYTITSCAPTVTNCPAQLGQVTTELVSLYTTICPVEQGVTTSLQGTSVRTSPSSNTPLNSSVSSAIVLTTSTAYTSSVYTISSCAPGAIECSSNIGSVTTELVALYTTVCPVKEIPTESSLPSTDFSTSATGIGSISSAVTGASSTLAELSSTSSPLATPSSAPAAPVYTTSTVYSTNIYTITACASDVTNCPGVLGVVTTEIVAVSTTVCPVSDKTVPTSVPQVTASGYTTTEVTISNTFSNSVIVITSIITFIDTPVPYSPTTDIPIVTTAGTAAVTFSSGIDTKTTQPCTTLTLGSYFTTVITYASLTQQSPASISPGSVITSYYTLSTPGVDVPSYTMTEVASTVEMSSSSTIVATTSVAATQSQELGTLVPDVTIITSSVTKGPQGEPGQCACEPTVSTVYATVTVTVAEITITRTETVEPPFPSTYGTGTGTGAVPLGTGASGQPTAKHISNIVIIQYPSS